MKVLCVIDSLGSGGAQRQLVGLAIGFKRRGYEVSFLTYHKINFFKDTLISNGISITTIVENNYLLRIFRLRNFIRKEDCDIVLSFLSGPSLISELAGLPVKKWKLIVGERSANPNMIGSFRWKLYKWAHHLADYVVANSHANIAMLKQISPLIAQKKCKVIYNLVDLKRWVPIAGYSPVNGGRVKIVVASSHRYLKNLDGLVEAMNLLSDMERKRVDISWFGDTLDASLEDAKKKIDKYNLGSLFTFSPATSRIQSIIAESDFVALFSFYEGLPNAICEGMASGKPIIASSISDVPYLVEEGVNGFLCDPKSPHSILGAIRQAIESSPEDILKMGSASRMKAEMLFDEETILDSYINLFEQND